jgi:MFS family permease
LLIGLIDGIFEVPLWLCIQASVADLSKEETIGGAMGLYSTAWGIGFALGPFFGGYLYGMIGAKTFIVGGLFVLFAALIAVCTKLPHPKLFETKMHENKFFKNLKNMKFFLPICLSGFIAIGTSSVIFKLFPVYARYLGFAPFQIGFLMGISMLVRTILFIPMGNLGDRAGYDRMISAGLLGLALTFAGMVVAKNLLQWGAVLILMGISGSILMPALLSKASLVGKTRGLGYTLGIYNFFTVMGWGVMPTVGGIVADIFGPTTPYLFCTLILLLTIGIIKIKKSK